MARMKQCFIIALCLFGYLLSAQKSYIDSLEAQLRTLKNDSTRLPVLSMLADEYVNIDPPKAISYANMLLKLADSLKVKKGLANAYITLGNIEHGLGNYDKAIDNYFKSINVAEKYGFDRLVCNNMVNIGGIHMMQGRMDKALEFFEKAKAGYEKLNDKKRMSAVLNNIAALFNKQGDYKKASDYFFAALKLKEELNDKRGMTYSYVNIGENYYMLKEFAKAKEYNSKAIVTATEIGDKYLLATAYINLADVCRAEGNYGALPLEYAAKCLALAKELGYKTEMLKSYKLFAELYASQKNFEKAYSYFRLYESVKDSIFNDQQQKQIAEMDAKYQAEKKDKEITLLNKDRELGKIELEKQKERAARQSVLKNAFILGFLLVLFVAFVVYRGYRQKRIANTEILKQKEIIEEKQKAILDSIHYAERIQKTLITSERYIAKSLSRLKKS